MVKISGLDRWEVKAVQYHGHKLMRQPPFPQINVEEHQMLIFNTDLGGGGAGTK